VPFAVNSTAECAKGKTSFLPYFPEQNNLSSIEKVALKRAADTSPPVKNVRFEFTGILAYAALFA